MPSNVSSHDQRLERGTICKYCGGNGELGTAMPPEQSQLKYK